MNEQPSANYEAAALIDAFLETNPLPTSAQWKALTLANSKYAVQITEAALLCAIDAQDIGEPLSFEQDLFRLTNSAMLDAVESNTAPVDAAKEALKKCRGPAARNFAREIGLNERVDLFNQMISGETFAPYILLKRLASRLNIHVAAMAEVFSLNFQCQPAQSFKADGKPDVARKPQSWEDAVKAAGITGAEATRLIRLEKELN